MLGLALVVAAFAVARNLPVADFLAPPG
jgi:hypothetical protein